MSDYAQFCHAKRLFNVASKAMLHAARRMNKGLPAQHANTRAARLGDLAKAAWAKVEHA